MVREEHVVLAGSSQLFGSTGPGGGGLGRGVFWGLWIMYGLGQVLLPLSSEFCVGATLSIGQSSLCLSGPMIRKMIVGSGRLQVFLCALCLFSWRDLTALL